MAKTITAELARRLLDYNPETGSLTWRMREGSDTGTLTFNTIRAGKQAGGVNHAGYTRITLNSREYYLAHRVIWLMMTGEWPEFEIDHINGDRRDNRWANLRPASRLENARNLKLCRRNRSGFKGVCWDAGRRKWVAYICADRKRKYLGAFTTPEAAHAAYCEAAEQLHGEFARSA